jgi:hypothetical protein
MDDQLTNTLKVTALLYLAAALDEGMRDNLELMAELERARTTEGGEVCISFHVNTDRVTIEARTPKPDGNIEVATLFQTLFVSSSPDVVLPESVVKQ